MPSFVQIHGGLLGKCVKYNQIFLSIPFFSETHLQVRSLDGFSRVMAQTTRFDARMCLFGVTKSKIII